jgi:hypothetical protein
VSERVAFRLPFPVAVVTWFVTEGLATPTGAYLRRATQPPIEISQAALKSLYKVWGHGWLSFGVTARWLGPRLIRLVDAKGRVQQLVGVRRGRMFGHEQQDASVGRLEDGKETPRAVKVQSANTRKLVSCQPHACGLASAPTYILHGQDEGCLRFAAQVCDLLTGQLRRYCRDRQLRSPGSGSSSSRRAQSSSSSEGTYSSPSSPARS